MMAQKLVQSVHSFNPNNDRMEFSSFANTHDSEVNTVSVPKTSSEVSCTHLDNGVHNPSINWDLAVYSIGIKEIDRQHGILVKLINSHRLWFKT